MDIAHNVVALPLSIIVAPTVVGGLAMRFQRSVAPTAPRR
jgi:hypothetical protein